MALAFLLPIFIFYGLFLGSLCAGLLACLGAFRSRRRHGWILGVSIGAIVMSSWMNYHYRLLLWEGSREALWFPALGLLPILLGSVSLVRWWRLNP